MSLLKFELRLTTLARKDLVHILSYTEKTWGIQQANQYEIILHKALDTIRTHPQIGRILVDLDDDTLCFNAGRHLIFYTTEETTIFILRILHDTMDYTTFFKNN